MTDSNTYDDNSNVDGLHQINSSYGYFKCITCNCKSCGPDQVLLEILESNEGIEDVNTLVEWQFCDWVEKNNSKFKQLDIKRERKPKKELVKQYIEDLKSVAFHLFSCNWNYSMFLLCKDNLKLGDLLQVLDFGQNYMKVYQDEPQGVHWDHNQTVTHPIVNYYLDDSGQLVTEEHVMLTDDLKHDKFAVREFDHTTLDHLKKKGFVPKKIIQFYDNCLGQYKSKDPFQFISDSGIPTICMFFSACHGKGPADGAVGRIKLAAKRAVKARQVVIENAQQFTEFCKLKFHNNS